MSEMPTSLAGALALLQTRLPDIRKGQTAKVKTKAGDTYTYTYAGLAAVAKDLMPLLGAVGLSFTARPTLLNGRFVLAYSLLHVGGDSMHGEYPLPSPMESSPQAVGSAVTYARRYVLCAIAGVVADDDDDGQAAADEQRHQSRREETRPETPTPKQATEHAQLLERIKASTTEAMLNAGAGVVREAFKGKRLTPAQANGLLAQIDERRRQLASGDAPPDPVDDEPVGPPPIDAKTRGRLFALLGEHDYKTPEERRAYASVSLGREVSSMTTLTETEGRTLIQLLEAKKRQEVPA